MLEHITASEVAGYGVGALLLCATITAPKIDSFISASQRSSLGMCKRCGDLKLIACSNCKGSGSLKQVHASWHLNKHGSRGGFSKAEKVQMFLHNLAR
ncbi:hypothetical protein HanXRQr2_Chr14g0652131 [Helianthus annuus]|uniref:Uncharacterized protein n=1 Tax=Helianthus annuus TaxID=4232 RepID=A0A9K3EA43_HELAN|nr:hypothetical protein HanXRQr2_Chr14g0652131 [Helianthus annuus]KAJ0840994.1 hypothetical protein HanPSC8_Chr14g0625351 [Helianthus annuus]